MKVFAWFKSFVEWLRPSRTVPTVEALMGAFDAETRSLLEDAQRYIEKRDKGFVVEFNVTNKTKMRHVKTTITDAIVQRLAVTNPEITDVVVKFDYRRNK